MRRNLAARQERMRARQLAKPDVEEPKPLASVREVPVTKPETPYSIKDVARLLNISVGAARRAFTGVRGVYSLPSMRGKPGKRTYLRIPRHVFWRVLQEWARQ